MVRITVKNASDLPALNRLVEALKPENLDPVADRVGLQGLAKVVNATPQRWFGQVRKSWQVQKPHPGARLIVNDNKIMLFLEEGTKDHGPVQAKRLFIPLTRRAALGYQPGMVYGQDFILVKRVRGITARHIARDMAVIIRADFVEALKAHLQKAIDNK